MKRTQKKVHHVLLSGGLDSAACVFCLQDSAWPIELHHIDYGQQAAEHERECARAIANWFRSPLTIWNARQGGDSFGTGEIIGRNLYLVSTLLTLAQITGGTICLGIHSGTPYYDCSREFIRDLQTVVDGYAAGSVQLIAPLVSWNKLDVVRYLVSKDFPIELARSCESSSTEPCDICSSCIDRRKALAS